jgi:DNA-binding NtrC family response regulator
MEVYALFSEASEAPSVPPRRRVLIVDDDHLVRDALRFALEDAGYDVWAVAHGADALAVLESQAVDIVLSDIFMPGMNGFELLKQIRQRRPDVPVILVTGFGNIEMARQALKEGATDFITKPYNVSEIPILIERNLMRHTIESSRTRDLQEEVRRSYRATLEALLAALDTRDTETEGTFGAGGSLHHANCPATESLRGGIAAYRAWGITA